MWEDKVMTWGSYWKIFKNNNGIIKNTKYFLYLSVSLKYFRAMKQCKRIDIKIKIWLLKKLAESKILNINVAGDNSKTKYRKILDLNLLMHFINK